ncbi:hypothetical protein BpHYR1_029527 [Brachionus plicatilis]|uniref:Uncharacterized protein n=1 Tax=Brachionus plicatilis TaxID=10195 RepID=A0A3M7P295_BRAPC|nr:hypothetical protein BpHYR1_029527 [Brachionus plicatilis]
MGLQIEKNNILEKYLNLFKGCQVFLESVKKLGLLIAKSFQSIMIISLLFEENPEGCIKFSLMSFASNQNQAISSVEQLKIESFYRSFGTSLFISQSCASLYTVQNSKIWPNSKNQANRISIATTHSINLNYQDYSNDEISHDILKDLMNDRHQNYVPVYHRGVPLWLFNSGKNPHRPVRQLKFTLAEKGTGFILWQDRIDANSEFNLYLTKKHDSSVYNVSSYFDNLSLINEIKREQIESMLVAFKASDKKTTVFMRFDLNPETIKFYEFYKRLIKNVAIDTKMRTKSLPVGYNNSSSLNRIKRSQQAKNNVNFYNYDYNLLEGASSTIRNKSKRQSCQIVSEPKERVRPKRISKNDISNPCNYKHVISLKASDKNSYYTLSKLLPSSSSRSSCSSKFGESKSESAKSCSVSSSATSSAMSSPISPSINCMSSEYLIQESSRSSLNPDVLNDQSSSSLSDSSLSTILPPFIGVSNGTKFFEMNSYNYKISRQRTY